jgi:hypothetical protein
MTDLIGVRSGSGVTPAFESASLSKELDDRIGDRLSSLRELDLLDDVAWNAIHARLNEWDDAGTAQYQTLALAFLAWCSGYPSRVGRGDADTRRSCVCQDGFVFVQPGAVDTAGRKPAETVRICNRCRPPQLDWTPGAAA